MPAPPENHHPRHAGSARFSTYYKVQYWDARNCAWADIQILAYQYDKKPKPNTKPRNPPLSWRSGAERN